MRAWINYVNNTFGNSNNAPQYSVKLRRSTADESILIDFEYEQPADGRGVGNSYGSVQRVCIEIPMQTTKVLSSALDFVASEDVNFELKFQIDEHPEEETLSPEPETISAS